ncbi:hypothetical protein ACFLUV_01345 [Elusimicrobiota bacterium]
MITYDTAGKQTFKPLNKSDLDKITRIYTDKGMDIGFAYVVNAVYKQVEATPILKDLKRTDENGNTIIPKICVVDEVADGSYDFLTAFALEEVSRRDIEEFEEGELRKKAAEIIGEDLWYLRTESPYTLNEEEIKKWQLLEDTIKTLRNNEGSLDVEIFVGKPRSPWTQKIPGYPSLKVEKFMEYYGMTREEAIKAINAVSAGADFMPHHFMVDVEKAQIRPIFNLEIPIKFEERDIQISAYLKDLELYNGVVEYYKDEYKRLGVDALIELIKDEKVSKKVKFTAIKSLSNFTYEVAVDALSGIETYDSKKMFNTAQKTAVQIFKNIIREAIIYEEGKESIIRNYSNLFHRKELVERQLNSKFPKIRKIAQDVLKTIEKAEEEAAVVGVPFELYKTLKLEDIGELKYGGVYIVPIMSEDPHNMTEEKDNIAKTLGFSTSLLMEDRKTIDKIIEQRTAKVYLAAEKLSKLMYGEYSKTDELIEYEAVAYEAGCELLEANSNAVVFRLSAGKADVAIKIYNPKFNYETNQGREIRGLLAAAGNVLYQQYLDHRNPDKDSAGYVITEYISGESFMHIPRKEWRQKGESERKEYARSVEQRLKQIPDEHWDQLINIYRYAETNGIILDFGSPRNFKYDKARGFVVLDIEKTEDEQKTSLKYSILRTPDILAGIFAENQIGEKNLNLIKRKLEEAKVRVEKAKEAEDKGALKEIGLPSDDDAENLARAKQMEEKWKEIAENVKGKRQPVQIIDNERTSVVAVFAKVIQDTSLPKGMDAYHFVLNKGSPDETVVVVTRAPPVDSSVGREAVRHELREYYWEKRLQAEGATEITKKAHILASATESYTTKDSLTAYHEQLLDRLPVYKIIEILKEDRTEHHNIIRQYLGEGVIGTIIDYEAFLRSALVSYNKSLLSPYHDDLPDKWKHLVKRSPRLPKGEIKQDIKDRARGYAAYGYPDIDDVNRGIVEDNLIRRFAPREEGVFPIMVKSDASPYQGENIPSGKGYYGAATVLMLPGSMQSRVKTIYERLSNTEAYREGYLALQPADKIHHTIHNYKKYQDKPVNKSEFENYKNKITGQAESHKPFRMYIQGLYWEANLARLSFKGYFSDSFEGLEKDIRGRNYPVVNFSLGVMYKKLPKNKKGREMLEELNSIVRELEEIGMGLTDMDELRVINHQDDWLRDPLADEKVSIGRKEDVSGPKYNSIEDIKKELDITGFIQPEHISDAQKLIEEEYGRIQNPYHFRKILGIPEEGLTKIESIVYELVVGAKYKGKKYSRSVLSADRQGKAVGGWVHEDNLTDGDREYMASQEEVLQVNNGEWYYVNRNEVLRDGKYYYIINKDNEFIYVPGIARDSDIVTHNVLSGQSNIYCGGYFTVEDGKITHMNTASGHYTPPPRYMLYAYIIARSRGFDYSNTEFAAYFKETTRFVQFLLRLRQVLLKIKSRVFPLKAKLPVAPAVKYNSIEDIKKELNISGFIQPDHINSVQKLMDKELENSQDPAHFRKILDMPEKGLGKALGLLAMMYDLIVGVKYIKNQYRQAGISADEQGRVLGSWVHRDDLTDRQRELIQTGIRIEQMGDGEWYLFEQKDILRDGTYLYAIDTDNRFRYVPLNEKNKQYIYHTQLAEGKNVFGAGDFTVRDGRILQINTRSGHYMPKPAYINYAYAALRLQGFDVSKTGLVASFRARTIWNKVLYAMKNIFRLDKIIKALRIPVRGMPPEHQENLIPQRYEVIGKDIEKWAEDLGIDDAESEYIAGLLLQNSQQREKDIFPAGLIDNDSRENLLGAVDYGQLIEGRFTKKMTAQTPPAVNLLYGLFSDYFEQNISLRRFERTAAEQLPQLRLDPCYSNPLNLLSLIGRASTNDLISLTITGKVDIKNADLAGVIIIESKYDGVIDLRQKMEVDDGMPLVLENKMISINESGRIIIVDIPSAGELLKSENFARKVGLKAIRQAEKTGYKDEVLTLSPQLYNMVADIMNRTEDIDLPIKILRIIIVDHMFEDKTGKELYEAYKNELKPYMSEIEILALPLWFNEIFPQYVDMKPMIMWEYVRKRIDDKIVFINPKKIWQIIDRTVRYNSEFLGEEQVVQAPKDAGAIAPGEVKDMNDRIRRGGIKQILTIFSRFRRAFMGIPIAGLNEIIPLSTTRHKLVVIMAAALGESGAKYSIENILERMMNILRGSREQYISPKLNKHMGFFMAT